MSATKFNQNCFWIGQLGKEVTNIQLNSQTFAHNRHNKGHIRRLVYVNLITSSLRFSPCVLDPRVHSSFNVKVLCLYLLLPNEISKYYPNMHLWNILDRTLGPYLMPTFMFCLQQSGQKQTAEISCLDIVCSCCRRYYIISGFKIVTLFLRCTSTLFP